MNTPVLGLGWERMSRCYNYRTLVYQKREEWGLMWQRQTLCEKVAEFNMGQYLAYKD